MWHPMADLIVTIASPFSVRDLNAFLAEPSIVALREHFENPDNSPTEEAGDFITRALDDGRGMVWMSGYCGMPTGDGWKEAIQRHIDDDKPMRISTAGFDAALKYTVAAAYDISATALIAVDASYGSVLGHEWFHSLPETKDFREQSSRGGVPDSSV